MVVSAIVDMPVIWPTFHIVKLVLLSINNKFDKLVVEIIGPWEPSNRLCPLKQSSDQKGEITNTLMFHMFFGNMHEFEFDIL